MAGIARCLVPSLLALVAPACGLLGGDEPDDGDAQVPVLGATAAASDESGGEATMLPLTLTRAKKRLRFIGKGSEHLGRKLTSLSKMYSLAGPTEIAPWSSPGEGDARRTRDDDLRTAWTCNLEQQAECAVGIHFPRPATVVAVRVNASPSDADDPEAFGRIRTLRIHTDEGWAEDRLLPQYEELVLQLGEAVTTRQLTIEVVDTQSKGATNVRIAEFDVFGTDGDARAPIEIDPATLHVRLDDPTWKRSGADRALTPPRLEYTDAEGARRLLAHGSAVFASGDRMLLIEELEETKCKSHVGRYTMLDRKTRIRVPLGDMGGLPGTVWLHEGGHGFAVGYVDENVIRVHALVLEGDTYQRKKSARASRDTYHEVFAEWGIGETPAPRGGGTLDTPPAGCEAGSDDDWTRLQRAQLGPTADPSAAKKRRAKSKDLGGPADRWLVCDLGSGTQAFISTGEACGSRYEVIVVDGQDRVVAREGETHAGSHVRTQRVRADALLVEVAGKDDAVHLLSVRADGIESLGMGTALAVSPPASCRDRCDTPFVNPRAP